MSAESVTETVVKGGQNWLELAIDRRNRGIEIWVKADPKVEAFIAEAGGGKSDDLEQYGRNWHSAVKGESIKVYQLSKNLDTQDYTFDAVCGSFEVSTGTRTHITNLSFYRFVGVSSPAGVRFIVEAPMTKEQIKQVAVKILTSSKRFFADHIVPIHIELRISSQEV